MAALAFPPKTSDATLSGSATAFDQASAADHAMAATTIGVVQVEMAVMSAQLALVGATSAGVVVSAAVAIEAGEVVTAGGMQADAANVDDAGQVLGVALASVAAGEPLSVATSGVVPVSGFAQGDVLYLGADGVIVTVVPSVGFQQRVGIAISNSQVIVCLGDPIVLI